MDPIVITSTITRSGTFDGGQTRIRASGVINAQDFGAKGVGSAHDDTVAIQKAIARVPHYSTPWADSRSAGMYVILLPEPADPDDYYYLTETITIPETKNICFVGGGKKGARVQTAPGVSYAFFIDSASGVFNSRYFLNISLDQCGLKVDDNTRNDLRFDSLFFHSSPEHSIWLRSSGEVDGAAGSVIGGAILDCEFFEVVGHAIFCQGDQSDLWSVERSRFIRGTLADVRLFTTGWTLRKCYFQGRKDHATNFAQPHVHLESAGGGGRTVLDDLRFGNEISNTNDPPREAILIGAIGSSEATSYADLHVSRCQFLSVGTPSATSGDCAIRANISLSNAHLDFSSTVRPFFTSLIRLEDSATHFGKGNTVLVNSQHAYAVGGASPVFNVRPSQGPLGSWDVVGREDEDSNPNDRECQQLFRNTDDPATSANWSESAGVTIARDVEGVDGQANSAWSLTKSQTGTATIAQTVTPPRAGWVCFSMYLRRGTLSTNEARISIPGHIASDQVIALEDDWVRYFGVFYSDGTGVTFTIGIGDTSETELGSIEWDRPQCEFGKKPSDWLPRVSGANGRSRPGGWRQRGRFIEGYRDGAPVSGTYPNAFFYVGDTIIESDGNELRCTVAGNPGTWN